MNQQVLRGSRMRERFNMPATAHVIHRGTVLGCYTVHNICAGGALLSGGPGVDPGSELQLLLNLPQGRSVMVDARVMRQQASRESGIALAMAFEEVDPDVEDTIQDALLSHLETRLAMSTVLVLDDCPNTRQAMRRDLKALRRPAFLAAMPLDALRLLQSGETPIDVAIVDLHLGMANGVDFLKYLREEYPEIRRVLISGAVQPSQLGLALATGHAHAVLAKPWDRAQMARALAA